MKRKITRLSFRSLVLAVKQMLRKYRGRKSSQRADVVCQRKHIEMCGQGWADHTHAPLPLTRAGRCHQDVSKAYPPLVTKGLFCCQTTNLRTRHESRSSGSGGRIVTSVVATLSTKVKKESLLSGNSQHYGNLSISSGQILLARVP